MSGLFCKIIASFAMLLDHIGFVCRKLLPYRAIGRIAFPLYAFLLAEGFRHTHNLRRYQLRLLAFAFLSEIPYNLLCTSGRSLWYKDGQNVFWTLFFALLVLEALRLAQGNRNRQIAAMSGSALLCFLAELLRFDYGAGGILTVLAFYYLWEHKGHLTLALFLLSSLSLAKHYLIGTPSLTWALLQGLSPFALLPLTLYNGEKGVVPQSKLGRRFLQGSFYAFYPLHLLVLVWLKFW